jgi:hypothetical protein
MYRFVPMFLVACCALQAAEAQPTIQWRTDVPGAVATAKQTHLPLMFYVLGRNEDRDDKIDNAQKRAFTDPKVLQLSHRFITTRLSRSANRDVLEELKLPTTMTQEIAFVTPSGKVIDRLSPSGVADPNALADKMRLVFDAYRRQLFTSDIQPVLDKPNASPEEMRAALGAIRDLNITSADTTLLKLIEREDLNRGVLFETYDVLAALSTKPGMEKLAELAVAGKPHADEALARTTPIGAEILADKMVEDDGTVRVSIYEAICKVCDIKGRKSQKWWDRAENRLLIEEVDRVKKIAKEAAARWRAMNEE